MADCENTIFLFSNAKITGKISYNLILDMIQAIFFIDHLGVVCEKIRAPTGLKQSQF